ncbi:hypothetical protein EGI22_22975 [Lacihabitans sp. LS3-19]|uniref:tetratricopeptide repeat protein n=1 Tax=Lacihabitans sp. LS3-19 TaxID=2487335 RepID=UPI0020CD85FA|nr:tetratricopeptide repeat protein [Lacihabitans sp. LS3-19]MCP9770778.1 hypothetical protein [Lacihabitans sp. LS3-19]
MEELIEKYFENTLTEQELKAFEENLRSNASFKEEFEFQKSLKQSIHLKERNELKSILKGFDNKNSDVRFEIQKNNKVWRFAAAAVVLILAAFGIYKYQTDGKNTQDLYLAYHQPYPNIVAPNVRGENTEGIKNEAFKAYEAENYQEAIRLFSQIKDEEFAIFYTAISYLELNENQKAIEILKSNKFSETPFPFETYNKWYLALAYLKTGQKNEAKTILEDLTKTDNPQKQKAQELLNEL